MAGNHMSSEDWEREARIAEVMMLFTEERPTVHADAIHAIAGRLAMPGPELAGYMVRHGFIRPVPETFMYERGAPLAPLDLRRFLSDRENEEPHLREHLMEVLEEAIHQDDKVKTDPPEQWAPHRNGVRLFISALEDEVREVLEAWDGEKKPAGKADPARWPKTRAELVQVSAVGLRAVRALSPEPATGVGGSA